MLDILDIVILGLLRNILLIVVVKAD